MLKKLALGALLLVFGLVAPAFAADVGGSCCADLEERIAELEATTSRKGNRRVSLTMYGSVNKAVLWVKGDDTSHHEVIENSTSPTRFGFMGEAKINKDWKAGYRIEVAVNDQATPLLDDKLSVRHSHWWLEAPMGKVTMGLASMATDGVASLSTANTDVASRMLSLQPISGVFLFGLDLPFNDLRRNLVRYDTPVMGGFMASASLANGDTPLGIGSNPDEAWDIALRYAGEFAGFRALAGVGLSQQDNNIGLLFGVGGRERVISGSASMMHVASGLFLNVAAGDVTKEQILGGADYRVGHVQGGLQKNFLGFGATTFYGEYSQMDIKGIDVNPTMMGAGVVQNIEAAAMDLYLAARRYDLDNGGPEITTIMGGARINF